MQVHFVEHVNLEIDAACAAVDPVFPFQEMRT